MNTLCLSVCLSRILHLILQLRSMQSALREIKATSVGPLVSVQKWFSAVFCYSGTCVLYVCALYSSRSFAFFPIGLSNPAEIHCEMEWKESREEAYAISPPPPTHPSCFYVLIGPSSLKPHSHALTPSAPIYFKRYVYFFIPWLCLLGFFKYKSYF
jgi:hypothetical protein